MSNPFKVGDTVELDMNYIANHTFPLGLNANKIFPNHDYVVADADEDFVRFDPSGGWNWQRFKLAEKKPTKKSEKKFTHAKFDQLVKETFDNISELSSLKGGEYAGDSDRLENFRRNGKRLDLPMEAIWHTYIAKHWDAVEQYIKDTIKGKTRKRMESLSSRLDDMILYCLLFKAMLLEKDEEKS